MTKTKLRIAHIIIQPILVWDDGEELTPGPELNPITITVSRIPEFISSLPAQLLLLESRIEEVEEP